MLTVMRGPSGCGKTQSLYRAIIDASIKNEHRNFLCIVPEQFTIATQKLLTQLHPNHGILNIDVLSFNRLAHRIFEEAGGDASEILDDTGKNLIIRQIASEHASKLTVLGAGMKKTGYISSIKSVISEFLQYDISTDKIDEMIEKSSRSPYLAAKLRDVRIIYGAFQEKLGSEYIAKEELLAKACRSADEAVFLKNSTICFDGFTGFTPVQYRFMQKLYDICGDITVTVTDDASGDRLFSLGAVTTEHLMKIGREGTVLQDVNDGRVMRLQGSAALTFLEKKLFRTGCSNAVFAQETDAVQIIRASDASDEARFVCSQIAMLVREKNYRYRDIAVIMGDTAEYADILRHFARNEGIPVFIDETSGIMLNPYTELLRAALAIMRDDFSYGSVFHFLRTGLTDIDIADIDAAENYVRALGIRGRKKYVKEWDAVYRGVDPDMAVAAERVRSQLMTVLAPLDMPSGRHTAGELTGAVYGLTVSLDIEEKLKKKSEAFETAGDMARAGEYRQIYALIIGLFDRIVDLLKNEEMDMDEYARMLDAGFSEIRVGNVPPLSDCVMAGDMTRSRFGDIRALFFVGLTDGAVPASGSRGGIISDLDRQFLKDASFELAPTAQEKTDTEKLYFYMNVTKPAEYLYLSCPGTASDGSMRRPSYFMNAVSRMFPESRRIDQAELKGRDGACGIYTEQDALEELSGTIGRPDEKTGILYRSLDRSGSGGEEHANSVLLGHMRDAAYGRAVNSVLSKAAARAVFGELKLESATELEKFAACEYAHFLQFGLHLEERYDFEFEARDLGTVLHGILSTYFASLREKGLDVKSIDESTSDGILEMAVRGLEDEKALLVLGSSARNAYMQKRLTRMAKRTVDTIRYQVSRGSFEPGEFEKRFEHNGLRGFIDRVDSASDGRDVYLDIVDYKSGNKDFDTTRIYYGLDLQLVIYLSAAMDVGVREYGYGNVHPAGIFYYHLDDPVVDGDGNSTDESIAADIRKKLKLRGMVNRDGTVLKLYDRELENGKAKSDVIPFGYKSDGSEDSASSAADEADFALIMKYADRKAAQFRQKILDGSIGREPYEYDGKTACDYCQYSVICDGGHKRRLEETDFPGDFDEVH